jgi:hypothetical protein
MTEPTLFMPKTLMLALSLLLSALSMPAQEMPPTDATRKAGKAEPVTLQGCLQSSDNQFMLMESDGTAHRLAGSGNKLSKEVGHEIEVTGKDETRTFDTTPQGGASSVKMITVFQVKTIKKVDDTCKSY